MSLLTSITPLIVPAAQIYLLFRIWRELKIVSADSVKRDELKKQIKDFGAMFAALAVEVPKPPGRKKVVSFEATEE